VVEEFKRTIGGHISIDFIFDGWIH